MNRCIIDACNTFQFERDFQVFCQFGIDPEEEIKKVPSPIPGTGLEPVCPADCWVKHFPVIQEVFRIFIKNTVFLPKHQQSRGSRMQFSISLGPLYSSDALKIRFVCQTFPDMVIPISSMTIAVSMNSFHVEIGDLHVFQHLHVRSFFSLIPQHGFDFRFRAVIISFTVSAECTVHQIIINENRLVFPPCSGNLYGQDIFAIQLLDLHILICKQIDADLFPIVDRIPEVFLKLRSILNSCCRKASIRIFRNSKQNHSTIAIGHGGISIPQVLRKAVFRLLCFQAVAFPVLFKSADIEFHASCFLFPVPSGCMQSQGFTLYMLFTP